MKKTFLANKDSCLMRGFAFFYSHLLHAIGPICFVIFGVACLDCILLFRSVPYFV